MNTGMDLRVGHAFADDARSAVAEFHAQVAQVETALVIFFCSAAYDLEALAAEIDVAFAGVPVIGCTTAGEIGPGGYTRKSLSGMSLSAASFVVETGRLDRLQTFDIAAGTAFAANLWLALQARAGGRGRSRCFGLLLIDGLSRREEPVCMSLQDGLGGIHLIGGSAGDDLRFERTWVFHEGRFHNDSAVLALVATDLPFRLLRTQHFVADSERLVVTDVDAPRRIVREINGLPAVAEYARLIGVSPDALTSDHFAASPVLVMIDGSEFVRSIQSANSDGSLTFYCAIEEGMVLRVGRGEGLLSKLTAALDGVVGELGGVQGMLVCDCILRNLEAARCGQLEEVGALFRSLNAAGFSTYGEQYEGVHVNQTMTGIAVGFRGDENE